MSENKAAKDVEKAVEMMRAYIDSMRMSNMGDQQRLYVTICLTFRDK